MFRHREIKRSNRRSQIPRTRSRRKINRRQRSQRIFRTGSHQGRSRCRRPPDHLCRSRGETVRQTGHNLYHHRCSLCSKGFRCSGGFRRGVISSHCLLHRIRSTRQASRRQVSQPQCQLDRKGIPRQKTVNQRRHRLNLRLKMRRSPTSQGRQKVWMEETLCRFTSPHRILLLFRRPF